MTPWHDHITAKIGLRIAGLMLLGSAWPEEGLLHRLVMARPAAEMSVTQFLLAALLFLSATAGVALTAMGPRLWKPAKLSARWSSCSPKQGAVFHQKNASCPIKGSWQEGCYSGREDQKL